MREVRVDRASNQLAINIIELAGSIVECANFCRADEGEVGRVEEEDDVLAGVVGQTDLLEGSLSVCHARKNGCGLRDLSTEHSQ